MESTRVIKVLVVSTAASLRQNITTILRDSTLEISTCDSLRSAFFTLVSQPVDLVFADDVSLDGEILDFISRLRLGGNKIPFVILTQGDRQYFSEEVQLQHVEVLPVTALSDHEKVKDIVKKLAADGPKSTLQRRFPRHSCNLDVYYETVRNGDISLSKGLSLGLGGMFLATSFALPNIGDFVSFRIATSDISPLEIEGIGVVRWVRERSINGDPSGFAIEFIGLTADTRDRVNSMISTLGGDVESAI